MRLWVAIPLVAIAASAARAQSPRFTAGLQVGGTTDYFYSHAADSRLGSSSRDLSIGIPVRLRVVGGERASVGFLGSFESSHPGGGVRPGTTQWALGPEIAARPVSAVELRLAGIGGWISRSGSSYFDADHWQTGFEAGVALHLRSWRLGYSFRRAWVRDVRLFAPPCTGICTMDIRLEPPRTLPYSRGAFELGFAF